MNILIYDDDESTREAYEYVCRQAIKEPVDVVFVTNFVDFHKHTMRHYDIALVDWRLDFFEDTYLTAEDVLPYIDAERKAIVTGFDDIKGKMELVYTVFTKPLRGYQIKTLLESMPREPNNPEQTTNSKKSRWNIVKEYFISRDAED